MSSQGAPAVEEVGGDPKVLEAFALGWNVAELFHGRIPAATPDRSTRVPDKLPGMGDLDDLARARLLLAEVTAGVHRVCPFTEHGLSAPDLTPLRESMDAPARSRRDVRLEIAALHSSLLSALTAADFRLGTAYGLGRALAETTLLPRADNPDTFGDSFHPFRLRRLETWLSDLKSTLPAHAAEGVRGSLHAWAAWVRQPRMEIWSEPDGKVAGSRRVDPTSTADRRRVDRALRRQGQVWRAMLSGEKLGVDLLSTEHYIEAAEHLVDRLGDLVGRFLKRYRLWVAGLVVLVVAVTAAAVRALALGRGRHRSGRSRRCGGAVVERRGGNARQGAGPGREAPVGRGAGRQHRDRRHAAAPGGPPCRGGHQGPRTRRRGGLTPVPVRLRRWRKSPAGRPGAAVRLGHAPQMTFLPT